MASPAAAAAEIAHAAAPAPRWLKRVDKLSFQEALRRLMEFQQLPPGRPDLYLPDDDDIVVLCELALRHAKLKAAEQQQFGLSTDECCAIVAYTMEDPYPLYLLLNAWMYSNRRDPDVKNSVGPFAALLIRALMKLPKVVCAAGRAIKVDGIPRLVEIFEHPDDHLPTEGAANFWGFSSFSTDDKVLESPAFAGKQTILYKCASLTAVDVSPFSMLPKEKEVLPIPPATFVVQVTAKHGKVLFVALKQTDNAVHAYVEPPAKALVDPLLAQEQPPMEPPAPVELLGIANPVQVHTEPQNIVAEASHTQKVDDICSRCKQRKTVVWNSLYGSGVKTLVCSECAQKVLPLTKEAFRATTAIDLREVCVILSSELDSEWCTLLKQKPPQHVAWFGDAPEPPLPPLATLVTRLNQRQANWLARTQHASIVTLTLHNTADGAIILALSGLTHLRHLALIFCQQITDAGLAHLTTLANLRTLNLSRCDNVTNAGLAHLTTLVNLQTLDLNYCYKITDAGLAHLKALVNLQTLEIDFCEQITDAGLAHLTALVNLQTLYLSSCGKITDAGLAHLKALVNLQSLDLGSCDQITDAGLAHLTTLVNLQTLYLSSCGKITDAGLAHLTTLSNLQTLNVSSCKQITDAGLAHLASLVSLQSLTLWSCRQITDAGLAHLRTLGNLRTLSLFRCKQITDAGLAHLKALVNLQTLDLDSCEQITDAGLAHLTALVKLQTLYLSSCGKITDAGLAHLTALVKLQSLDLSSCGKITDAGLAHLKTLANLRTLNLEECNQITDAGLVHVGFVKDLRRP